MNINIVSLNIPFPPNYGGIIDIFYKIKALKQIGVNVYLHCFEYGRNEEQELLKYCKKVTYYKRKTGVLSNLSTLPYIIYSRRNDSLVNNLKSNNYPILFEGLHTVYHLIKGEFKNRDILLRFHNVEHHYYWFLAKQEKNIFKKLYFYKEAFLLKRVLSKIPPDLQVATISPSDTTYFKHFFNKTFWLPPFHSNNEINSITGQGNYVLYHGNLSVRENITAAVYLIKQFAGKKEKIVIAGKNPSKTLIEMAKNNNNIEIICNPDNEMMDDLIKNAHAILLPTFQTTGIKLKLIESLYKGRFCIVNQEMVKNTMLEDLCIVTKNDFYSETIKILKTPFSDKDKKMRVLFFEKNYNNRISAQLIIEYTQKS